MVNNAQLIEGPIDRILVRMTIPMIVGILSMIAFNLTDTFFVGRLGTSELAAMSFTFPVIFIINSLTMGIGMGATAVISRAIGSGDHNRVRRLTTDSLGLALLLVGILASIGLLTINPVFRALGATGEILPLVKKYISIWYPGVIFVVIPMVGNSAIRATGDTRTPSLIMLVAVTVNAILDPLLIFGIGPFPRLELEGAAIATVTARATTMVVSLWVLIRREHMITLIRPRLKQVLDSWRNVLYIGLPSAGTNMIIPLAIGIITRMVAGYGPPAVAALGVSTRIDPFALGVIFALGSALGPFVGQNYGARKIGRVWMALRHSHRFAFVWGLGMLSLIALAAQPIASVFSKDPEVVGTTVLYLRLVPIGYGMQGVLMLSNVTLNMLNKPLHAASIVLIQMFVLYIPLALLGSALFGLVGIFTAAATASLVAGVLAYVWVRRVLRLLSGPDCSEPGM
ncbi:MAG: MATE family efflux transporter [Candidatus Latescibacteria bacterium]|nr:MATE family efflux transporter [Candidatus Latescibacterota bacterium]